MGDPSLIRLGIHDSGGILYSTIRGGVDGIAAGEVLEAADRKRTGR